MGDYDEDERGSCQVPSCPGHRNQIPTRRISSVAQTLLATVFGGVIVYFFTVQRVEDQWPWPGVTRSLAVAVEWATEWGGGIREDGIAFVNQPFFGLKIISGLIGSVILFWFLVTFGDRPWMQWLMEVEESATATVDAGESVLPPDIESEVRHSEIDGPHLPEQ